MLVDDSVCPMFLEAVWAENEALFGLCLIGYYLIKVLNLSAQKWPNVMLVFFADQLWLSTFPLALTLMYHAYAPHQHPSRVWLASERSPWRYRANTDLASSAGGCGEESRENRSITTKIIKHQSKLNITTYLPAIVSTLTSYHYFSHLTYQSVKH